MRALRSTVQRQKYLIATGPLEQFGGWLLLAESVIPRLCRKAAAQVVQPSS